MGKYNFDAIIDRKNTNSVNVENWRPYIFGSNKDRKFPYADDDFIRMWVADMEFAIADEILDAIRARLDKKILGYTTLADEEYFTAFERWCRKRYDFVFSREELVFSSGVIPALYQFTEDLTRPDEKVVTLTPAYGFFRHAATYSGAEMVASDLINRDGDYFIDFDDLEKKVSDPKVKIFFLCNPHNPTGRIWTEEELLKMAEIIKKYDIWVVSDEIHCDILRCGKRHIPMANIMPDYDKLITCMSASKTFNLAGLMHSSIIIRNEEERNRFVKRNKNGGNLNPLSIEAHKAAYEKGEEWLEALKSYIDGNLDLVDSFIRENIPEARLKVGDATYFAWIDFSKVLSDVSDLPLFFADNAGVLLEGGDAMFVKNAEGFVRLSLAMPRATVEKAMLRIKNAIDRYKSGDYIG